MQHFEELTIIGLMSGTSLDGVDLACCQFSGLSKKTENSDYSEDSKYPDFTNFSWKLLAADTIPYNDAWRKRLSTLEKASAYEYALANVELGHYFGKLVSDFIKRHNLCPDYVASHGHTIFHQPPLGLTTQIGDGDSIAAECGLPVVFNFRTLDVALGGQGAPLVPIGDRILFADYDACLNLGGIANISYGSNSRIAFDICPCNMALNLLAQRFGKPYDKGGNIAKSGETVEPLLRRLNELKYYRQPAPKSLGKEWFVSDFQPIINDEYSVQDTMRTVTDHIAMQIAAVINANSIRSMLVTGGGAKNCFLIERLRVLVPDCKIIIPSDDIIDFKEAIIFALLGHLRLNRCPNCLRSVTGAAHDNIGGNLSGLTTMS